MKEVWRPVARWPYEVSSAGRIRHVQTKRVRRITPHKSGYCIFTVGPSRKRVTLKVHRLVAAAFIGPCPLGKEVNHKDGSKANNRWTNLEYVTPTENIRHSFSLGLHNFRDPNRHARTRLTISIVKDLRATTVRPYGWASAQARKHGVATSTIDAILRGVSWKNV